MPLFALTGQQAKEGTGHQHDHGNEPNQIASFEAVL
jgi:hypothetical protein